VSNLIQAIDLKLLTEIHFAATQLRWAQVEWERTKRVDALQYCRRLERKVDALLESMNATLRKREAAGVTTCE